MMLLSGRPTNVSGTCVACVMEGSRPILAEVQALVIQKRHSAVPAGCPPGLITTVTASAVGGAGKARRLLFRQHWTLTSTSSAGCGWMSPAADLPVALGAGLQPDRPGHSGRCGRLWGNRTSRRAACGQSCAGAGQGSAATGLPVGAFCLNSVWMPSPPMWTSS